MRTTAGSQKYADWLIELGNGTLVRPPALSQGVIEIPQEFLLPQTTSYDGNITSLIHHVFGNPANLLDENVSEQICDLYFTLFKTQLSPGFERANVTSLTMEQVKAVESKMGTHALDDISKNNKNRNQMLDSFRITRKDRKDFLTYNKKQFSSTFLLNKYPRIIDIPEAVSLHSVFISVLLIRIS